MSRHPRLTPEKINKILDKATEGVTLKVVADHAGVAVKTVWDLMNEFPLWGWYRNNK